MMSDKPMNKVDKIPIRINIVSDVVCPWCIIGYKRLETALAMQAGRFDVSLRWHPFELNPHMPAQGQNLRELLAQKYGTTPEQSRAARTRLTALGQSLEFRFDYFDEMRMVKTFRAHQLLHWAGEQGRQTELKLALFEAYFSHQKDVSDIEVLATAAARAGLSVTEARAVLVDGRYAEAVRVRQQQWLNRGIHAVPTFVFNDKFQIPGAQELGTFAGALDKLATSTAA